MSKQEFIQVRGARVNNLKNLDVDLPQNKLISIIGPSGCGKTSLAFHTLYAESKRRFINSFPNSMKLFVDRPASVDVDEIFPILPTFALAQINPVIGARSTAMDILHLTNLFEAFFFQSHRQYCPKHKELLEDFSPLENVVKRISNENKKNYLFLRKEDFIAAFPNAPFPTRGLNQNHEVENFHEELPYWEVLRFKSPLKTISKIKEVVFENYTYFLFDEENLLEIKAISNQSCSKCDYQVPKLSPKEFNPYNALGACSNCSGHGAVLEYDYEKLVDESLSVSEDGVRFINYKRFNQYKPALLIEMKKLGFNPKTKISLHSKEFKEFLYEGKGKYPGFNKLFKRLEAKRYKAPVRIFIRNIQKEVICTVCEGTRLNPKALATKLVVEKLQQEIKLILNSNISDCYYSLKQMNPKDKTRKLLLQKLLTSLEISIKLGIGHLKLLRKTKTLSPGEYQRLLLVRYLAYQGTGALFVFDEPSLGLSSRELKYILKMMRELVAQKNTVILIEHSKELIKESDWIIEIGPEAGHKGGELVYNGPYKEKKSKALDLKSIKKSSDKSFKVLKPRIFNQFFKDIIFPKNTVSLAIGESGSGKTSVLLYTLANHINYKLKREFITQYRGEFKKLDFPSDLKEVIVVNSELNKFSSRSTVGSLLDLSTVYRKYFSGLLISKGMGLEAGHFSVNSKLGQCPECEGRGFQTIEMGYLEDIQVQCEECDGNKLKKAYSTISDGKFTVAEGYLKPINEVFENIKLTPKYQKILRYFELLNLNYLNLARPIQSLSGGEKQRIYLLSKLVKNVENSLILLENISFGLSDREIIHILTFLEDLTQKKNTIVIIDQNPLLQKLVNNQISF